MSFCEYVLGGIRRKLAAVEGGDPAIDFLRPSGFNFRHWSAQGLQQGLSEFRSLFGSELAGLFFDLFE